MINQELKKIKNKYGEEMMHLCRKLFPTILETPNLLYTILEKNIKTTKSFIYDITKNQLEEDFQNFIYSFIEAKKNEVITNKTPHELLKEVGYILYECKTEEDIQFFKKYYEKTEKLCTFNGGRLDNCYVFFAVKENVDEIKREDFKEQEREDLYGTSVISIQFSKKDNNTLSIKNRYNHTVNNPDATFSNNLENIIPGLTNSFEKEYNLNINQEINNCASFLITTLNYKKANDRKYYRYNYEINNIYYCENNIIIENGNIVDKYAKEKERYEIIDYFIIDKKEKTITLYDKKVEDSFINTINKIGKIKEIVTTKDKIIIIKYENDKKIGMALDNHNCIISYKNDYIETIEDNFLYYNKSLLEIQLSKVKMIGNNFLYNNKELVKINFKEVKTIGDNFLFNNVNLSQAELLKLEIIGNSFLTGNKALVEINLPKVRKIGDNFLFNNIYLSQVELLKLEIIGNSFLTGNKALVEINLPEVKKIGDDFLFNNVYLSQVELSKLEIIGNNFLTGNKALVEINLPQAESIGNKFLFSNEELTKLKAKNLKKIGTAFLYNNNMLSELDLLNVEIILSSFLSKNEALAKINLPKVKIISDAFLYNNKALEQIDLPQIEMIGKYFLYKNRNILRENLEKKRKLMKKKY